MFVMACGIHPKQMEDMEEASLDVLFCREYDM